MRVLFVHGQESGPQGTKARLLAEHFEARTPQMDTQRFEGCVRQIAQAIAEFAPEVVVGSSFGGAVAVALLQRGLWRGPTLLLAPAPAALGVEPRLPAGVPVWIVHGGRDDVVPPAASLILSRSGSPELVRLFEVNDDHRLSATVASGRLVALVRELAQFAREPQRSAGERHLRVFFEEPALWPVLVAAAGGLSTLLAWLLATAFRTRNPVLLFGIAALAVASAEPVRRSWRGGRPGLLGGAVLALWALGIVVAILTGRAGVF
jgi:pimeloyl-ACP methyl ester carboxylesterase